LEFGFGVEFALEMNRILVSMLAPVNEFAGNFWPRPLSTARNASSTLRDYSNFLFSRWPRLAARCAKAVNAQEILSAA
jgi:hypothetical protein